MSQLYKSVDDYTGPWPYKSFTKKEVACKHCGEFYYDQESMDALQELRDAWGKPIVLDCGHRCPVHNAKVGGVESSQHLKIAFDCVCPADEQEAFIEAAKQAGFRGVGRYPSRGFVHLDMGIERSWRG